MKKILYLNQGSEYDRLIKKAFREGGCEIREILIHRTDQAVLKDFSGSFGEKLKEMMAGYMPDFFFTVDYYPSISALCMNLGIRYVSWVLSARYENVYSATALNSCNQIYLFDMEMVKRFAADGIRTVRYLPFGAEGNQRRSRRYEYDVSFIGSLCLTPCEEDFPVEEWKDSTRGYLEGLTAMQRQVYGYDFFENVTPDYVLEDLKKCCPPVLQKDNRMKPREYYAEQYFHGRVTDVEREINLNYIAATGIVDLFTDREPVHSEKSESLLRLHAFPAGDGERIRKILRASKVNVNLTPRSVRSGICSHAWEILGAGGFLLSDFREEYYDWFVPGEDLIVCESSMEMASKAAYYRSHDSARERIAIRGHEKALKFHGWKSRTDAILRDL